MCGTAEISIGASPGPALSSYNQSHTDSLSRSSQSPVLFTSSTQCLRFEAITDRESRVCLSTPASRCPAVHCRTWLQLRLLPGQARTVGANRSESAPPQRSFPSAEGDSCHGAGRKPRRLGRCSPGHGQEPSSSRGPHRHEQKLHHHASCHKRSPLARPGRRSGGLGQQDSIVTPPWHVMDDPQGSNRTGPSSPPPPSTASALPPAAATGPYTPPHYRYMHVPPPLHA